MTEEILSKEIMAAARALHALQEKAILLIKLDVEQKLIALLQPSKKTLQLLKAS